MPRHLKTLNPSSRPLLATVCGLATGLLAAVLILVFNDGNLVTPITVSARDCGSLGPTEVAGVAGGTARANKPGHGAPSAGAIRSERGERWFCADTAALANGWRHQGN